MSVRTLAVGCPRWPVVAADIDPEVPAAVFFANRVVVASSEAVACGIRKGMRRREAQARIPEIEVLQHDPARDARTFEAVVEVIESFAPRVEIVRPGLAVIASRGPARYFGGESKLREKIAEAVDERIGERRSYPLHIDDRTRTGIADGPFASTLAAAHGRIVPPLGTPSFLAPLPVNVLDMPDLAEMFVRLGLRTLGDVSSLDRNRIVARFGAEGEIAHRLASGDDHRLLEPRPIPDDLTVTAELDPPATRVDVAMFAGKTAADELAAKLMARGLACAKIQIFAQTEHGEERSRIWRYSAAFTPAAIAERVRWQLEGWLHESNAPTAGGPTASGPTAGAPTAGINILKLVPEDVGPATGTKVGFWNPRGEVSDRVRRSIARIQGLLGQHGAKQATLSGGRHPSEQATLVAWGDPVEAERPGLPGVRKAAGPVAVEMPPWPGRLPVPSPVLVHDRQVRAEVVDEEGVSIGVSGRGIVTARPSRALIPRPNGGRGGWREVTGWAGPWPVDERWWDETTHRRRARIQVSLDDGTAHLLSLEDGKWTAEATYD